MPHSALYIKKLGFFKAQQILLSDWMRTKYTIEHGGGDAKIYPTTNIEVARKAHQKHIKNMRDPNEELQYDTQEDIQYMEGTPNA